MKPTTLLSMLALALVATAATSCTPDSSSTVCTRIGYENGLRVAFQVAAGGGSYRVEVEAEGEVLGTHFDTNGVGLQCRECDVDGERIALRAAFVDVRQAAFGVNIVRSDHQTGPDEATVRVFRDGALAAEATFKPRYETDEPNGPGCGVHSFASALLVVP